MMAAARLSCAAATALLLLSSGPTLAHAADEPAAVRPPEVHQLAPDAWVLIGQGCNVLILKGHEGVLLVDDQRPRDTAETLAAVAEAGGGPVRYALNTHWHLDHSGGDAALAKLGAVIVAQEEVRVRRASPQYMPAYKVTVPAGAPEALPGRTYKHRMELRFGGERVTLLHAPAAHTDGDSIVWLPRADVMHLGDIYFHGIWPFIDRASGGSIQGMIAGVDRALALADERTRIVPGHGAVASKSELKAYRGMLADVEAKVREAIRSGHTVEQIVAAKPAAAYRPGMEGEEDRFVEAVYDSLIKS
jgi:glyoxylase-like metal-dependent hydrolase (beta-lactamase superfamily II)